MSNETAKTFPWWGYFEVYLFGFFGVLFTSFKGLDTLHVGIDKIPGIDVSSYASSSSLWGGLLLSTVLPAMGIVALETARRRYARRGELTTPPHDTSARPNTLLRYATDISFEEALGAFMPARIMSALFMLSMVLLASTQFIGLNPALTPLEQIERNMEKVFMFWVYSGGAIVVNVALAFFWRSGVRATTHIVKERRALAARNEATRDSELGGALSVNSLAGDGGALSMSQAGELTEHVEVALDFDAEARHSQDETEHVAREVTTAQAQEILIAE